MESFICCVPFGALAETTFDFCVVFAPCVTDADEPPVVFWLDAAGCVTFVDCDAVTGCDTTADCDVPGCTT
ncbi:MAG: hypothetical protein K2M91_10925, partial [Lachnospiraceae bacterium]|nr:hypothetical protein [Lachnospiraceae bacterium]